MGKIRRYIKTMQGLLSNYGPEGLYRGIINKLLGRNILYGIDASAANHSLSDLFHRASYTVGSRILQRQQNELTEAQQRQKAEQLALSPLVSVIIPVCNTSPRRLKITLQSLQNQSYANWELCAAYCGSPDSAGAALLRQYAQKDPRIRLTQCGKNAGTAAAAAAAAETARGEFIALLEQGDALTPDALFRIAEAVNLHPDADCLYSDECRSNMNSRRPRCGEFFFKPDPSPEMLLNFMYMGHLTVYRNRILRQVGGFRDVYDYAYDYDLALRVCAADDKIYHIERVLYLRAKSNRYDRAGGKRFAAQTAALEAYLKTQGFEGTVKRGRFGSYPVAHKARSPKISIIIPTDSEKNARQLLHTLSARTSYVNTQIVPVLNSGLAELIKADFSDLQDRLKLCRYDGGFNFSDKCNRGAEAAEGQVLIFLNDDAVPNRNDWIERMLDLLYLPGVGGVSPAMLYTDNTVQYAGMWAGQKTCGLFGPSFHRTKWNKCPHIFNHRIIRDVTALSGACMMIQKKIFEQIGGFDAINTPNRHSDIELSLRLRERGLRCVYTPYSTLLHPGNGSWAGLCGGDKANLYLMRKYGDRLCGDPYFTDSMRSYYEGSEKRDYAFICPQNAQRRSGRGDILMICHELSRTGAPKVHLEAARLLRDEGYYVVAAAPEQGPMLRDFLDAGIPMILDSALAYYRWQAPQNVPPVISDALDGIIRDFDLVICSTYVTHNIINCYAGTDIPFIWWIHEGNASFCENTYVMPDRLPENVTCYCAGLYSQQALKSAGIDYPNRQLMYGIADRAADFHEIASEKAVFVFPGSFEARKNQQLLLDAIGALPPDAGERAEFLLIGSCFDKRLYKSLKSQAAGLKNTRLLETIPYEELMRLYRRMTCMVVPSLDDPMPIVATEAMMLSKPVLCSNGTGTSRYIEDGVNGFVFDCRDYRELAEKLEYIIRHAGSPELKRIAERGRKVYEDNFSMELFGKNLMCAVEEEFARKGRERKNNG